MSDITKRRGVIKISYDLVHFPYYDDESHKTFCKLFSLFVPLHIINNGFFGELEYYGYCEFFDVIAENVIPPQYLVVVKKEENGDTNISFERIKEE